MALNLTKYGILNEESDYRVHVCFAEGYVYRFPTVSGKQICLDGKFPQRSARQPGVGYVTARGYIIPPKEISNCLKAQIPNAILTEVQCKKAEDVSTRGIKAVEVVKRMLLNGLIPITLSPQIISEKDLQIKGMDILVEGQARIQVKCDFDGGESGTGNLFLQTEECNPFGKF